MFNNIDCILLPTPTPKPRSYKRVDVREEELAKDQSGCRPVQEEVVPLYGSAYEARCDYLTDGLRLAFSLSANTLHDSSFPQARNLIYFYA
jgi:hypothetical protein